MACAAGQVGRLVVCLLLASIVALVSPLVNAAERSRDNYADREDVRQFVDDMVTRHGLSSSELQQVFRRARKQASVIRAMTPPADAPQRSWQSYRSIFVNSPRIEAGTRFWARNEAALTRAATEYGVPEEVIAAIIGIETVYGRNLGTYRVIDALSTLAFDFPRRAEYFRGELEHFLLFARDAGIDVLGVKGSYAGAIGIPQFMPGSYRRFGVDFDGDGRTDLAGSATDAIGSVANFLRAHGWRRGEVALAPARVDGQRWRILADAGIKPLYLAGDLPLFGVSTSSDLPPDMPCVLVELESPGDASEFRIGLNNFYAVTRYNRSSFYAVSVLELAAELAAARRSMPPR